ncbi:MAG: hypothetical protein RLP12_16235, partial [Ekhidna sp.]
MLNLIIFIAVILIIAVIFTAYRVTTLVDVVKKDKSKSHVPSGNSFQGVLMFIFLVLGVVGF